VLVRPRDMNMPFAWSNARSLVKMKPDAQRASLFEGIRKRLKRQPVELHIVNAHIIARNYKYDTNMIVLYCDTPAHTEELCALLSSHNIAISPPLDNVESDYWPAEWSSSQVQSFIDEKTAAKPIQGLQVNRRSTSHKLPAGTVQFVVPRESWTFPAHALDTLCAGTRGRRVRLGVAPIAS
jgi:hypothetical protein